MGYYGTCMIGYYGTCMQVTMIMYERDVCVGLLWDVYAGYYDSV